MSQPSRSARLEVDVVRLEAAIAEAGPKELPALVREHRIILAELAGLSVPQKGSTRDQLAEKRAARKAGSSGSAPAKVRQ